MWSSYLATVSYALTVVIALAHIFYFVGKRLFVTREEYTVLEQDHELHKKDDETVMGQLNTTLQTLTKSVDKNTEVTEKLGIVVNSLDRRQAVIEERISHSGS